MKIGFITGITGQDGSYLAELLLEKNYKVFGMIRRSSSFNTQRIEHIYDNRNLYLRYGDLLDSNSIINILNEIKNLNPDIIEIYNLGAQSHVKVSFELPNYTSQVDSLGTLNILESVKQAGVTKIAKIYQAGTSELYGDVLEIPQTEKTPFNPQSPYAVAKLYSYWIIKNYRDAYGLFACNGILFNHESPRRGKTFVTRKITRAVANIYLGKQENLVLGNLDSKRDWGHAKDYVYAMWLMLQRDKPKDYVISTNESYSVREFVELVFKKINIIIKWKNEGLDEIGIDEKNNKILVKIDKKYYRPLEVNKLLGDSSLARNELGWKPKYTFEQLIDEMLLEDLGSNQLPTNNTGHT